MKTTMFAVVTAWKDDGSDRIRALFAEEAEAWMEAEDYAEGDIHAWVAAVAVDIGGLYNVTTTRRGEEMSKRAAKTLVHREIAAQREP